MELTCKKCGFTGECEHFREHPATKSGYLLKCLKCDRDQKRQYYHDHKDAVILYQQSRKVERAAYRREYRRREYAREKQRAYQSDYWVRNKETIAANRRAAYSRLSQEARRALYEKRRPARIAYLVQYRRRPGAKEKQRTYYADYYTRNKEKILHRHRVYRAENVEKVRRGKRLYYERNKERIAAYYRVYSPLSLDAFGARQTAGDVTPHEVIADTRAVDPYKNLDTQAVFDWVYSLPHSQSTVVWAYMEALESVPVEQAAAETARVMSLTESRVVEIMEQVRLRAKWQIPM